MRPSMSRPGRCSAGSPVAIAPRSSVSPSRRSTRATPPDLMLHLIVDNSSTHTTEAIRDFLAAHPRFHLHFTPTSASWFNAVETWFGQLERRALRRGVFTSVTELREEIRRFTEAHNTHAAKALPMDQVGQRHPRCCRKGSRDSKYRHIPHGTLPSTPSSKAVMAALNTICRATVRGSTIRASLARNFTPWERIPHNVVTCYRYRATAPRSAVAAIADGAGVAGEDARRQFASEVR